MNLFIKELRMNVKSLIIWCFGVIIFLSIIIMKNVGINNDSSSDMTNIISHMPKSLQTIFGFGTIDISKTIGVLAISLFYIALILAFHASSLGTSCFAKEERDKTFEFLYVKGMTRNLILTIKVITSLIQIFILNIITYGLSIIMVRIVSSENIYKEFLSMMVGMFFLQLIFFSIGLLLSLIIKDSKKASNASLAIIIFCFISSMLSDISKNVEGLKYLTPFKYFDGKDILINGLNYNYIMVCLILSIIFIGYSFKLHNKHDFKV